MSDRGPMWTDDLDDDDDDDREYWKRHYGMDDDEVTEYLENSVRGGGRTISWL